MTGRVALRVAIAVGSLLGGAIHLRLYFDAYRDVPIENIGRSFVANAIASGVAAIIVLVVAHRWAVLVPLAVANATLVAFGLSRTDRGIFGFTERGWTPSPDAALSVIVEIATATLCVVALTTDRDARTVHTQPGAAAHRVEPTSDTDTEP